jgi:hypothetical protein
VRARPAVANAIGSQNLNRGGALDQFLRFGVTSGDPTVRLRLVTVAPWTLSVQPTCTPRVGPLRQI